MGRTLPFSRDVSMRYPDIIILSLLLEALVLGPSIFKSSVPDEFISSPE